MRELATLASCFMVLLVFLSVMVWIEQPTPPQAMPAATPKLNEALQEATQALKEVNAALESLNNTLGEIPSSPRTEYPPN